MKKIIFSLLLSVLLILAVSCNGDPKKAQAEQTAENIPSTPVQEESKPKYNPNNALRFTAEEDGSIAINAPIWFNKKQADLPKILYSTDGTTWQEYKFKEGYGSGFNGTKISLKKDQSVYFVNSSRTFSFDSFDYLCFTMEGKIKAEGNIMSLIYSEPVVETKGINDAELTEGVFYALFENCTSLTEAPALPATTLKKDCYKGMFSGCTALKCAPALIAENFAEGCYEDMFYGCNQITQIEINLDSLTDPSVKDVFGAMLKSLFDGIATTGEIINAGEEKVSTLNLDGVKPEKWESFDSLDAVLFEKFYMSFTAKENSTVKLRKVGTPSTTVVLQYCTDGETWNDYTIGEAIALNADQKVYFKAEDTNEGFSSDSENYYGFETTGNLKIGGSVMSLLYSANGTDTLYEGCFNSLFKDCTAIKDITLFALPAETLAEYCYSNMFSGCTSLTEVTSFTLPATTLEEHCYDGMFAGCTSLKQAPNMKAKVLATGSCNNMFSGCSSLKCVIVDFEDFVKDALTKWLDGANTYGVVFYTNDDLDEDTSVNQTNGKIEVPDKWNIPALWDSKNISYKTALVFTAKTDATISAIKSSTNGNTINLVYSTDNINWNTFFDSSNNAKSISLKAEEKVYIRAADEVITQGLSQSTSKYFKFTITGSVFGDGNVNALLDPTGEIREVQTGTFATLFDGCEGLLSSPMLPGIILAENCYNKMFQGCKNMVSIPDLSVAIADKASCCSYMFKSCSKIKATTVTDSSYNYELPINTTASSSGTSYSSMFSSTASGSTASPKGYKDKHTTMNVNCRVVPSF